MTYHIRTLVKKKDKLEWQKDTTVRISKSASNEPWAVTVTEGSVPFNPNWWPSGRMDTGDMSDPMKWLYDVINFIGKNLQFQPDVINPRSPANGDANTYWLAHRNDRDENGEPVFPTDNSVFPVPEAQGEAPKPQITIRRVIIHDR